MLRLGIIDYINSLPFSLNFTGQAKVVLDTPTGLNQALRNGMLDVSFISAAEYITNKNLYTLLPDFCIGAKERVMSVKLYVRHGIPQLDGKVIAVTPQSASSVLLLKILCHHFWKVNPQFLTISDDIQYEGLLLIGDACLLQPELPGFQSVDLAEAWYLKTKLPFTFGVLAARNDIMVNRQMEVMQLQKELAQALAWSRGHRADVVQEAYRRCPAPVKTLHEYYDVIRHTFDAEQKAGLKHFAALVEELYAQHVS